MRYFIDTEFIEDGKTIDLISLGMVCEDGREFYALNEDCNFSKASDWVLKNVLNPMGLGRKGWLDNPQNMSPRIREEYFSAMPRSKISSEVLLFLGWQPEGFSPSLTPEFWGWYSDYDWVVFCQLFGTMMSLPKGFPMYCRDLKQECDRLGNPHLPKQKVGLHNALSDARWNKAVYDFLTNGGFGGL